MNTASQSRSAGWSWAATLGEPLLAAFQAAAGAVRRALARRRQQRRAWGAYDALRRLDDRTLRDLGLDRSELTSIAAEFAGDAGEGGASALERTSTRQIFYGRGALKPAK